MSRDQPFAVPVVMVHGWGSSYARTWRDTELHRQLTDDGREVIGVDLLGHGRSRAPRDPAEYAAIADEFESRLPSGEPLDGIGFSLGGKMLLQVSARQPHRFRRLVITGVGDNLFRPENASAIARVLLHGADESTPAAMLPIIAEAIASGNDPLALAAVIQRPPRVLVPGDLKAIGSEVLVIVGEDDVAAGPTTELVRSLPNVTTVLVDGLDHAQTPRNRSVQNLAHYFLKHGEVPADIAAERPHPQKSDRDRTV